MGKENSIQLSDNKKLCYAEYGNPVGKPIFLLHGNPGSRLSWGLIPGSPFLPDIRIIAPDRPGYGSTDFKPNALQRWPKDMSELADHLSIDRFSLFAPSGGGPYVLACAWSIPDRLNSIGIFGSVGPNVPEATHGAIKSLKLLWRLSNPLFPLIKLQMKMTARYAKKNPDKLAEKMKDLELSEYDKKIFKRREIKNIFKIDFPIAYQQDGIGSAYDTTIPAKWPIPLEKIESKIYVWHAEEDILVGNMSKYIASKLPNAALISIPKAGHLWILDHMKDVLETLHL
ncbi:MAG: alpha/beta hydrolase [Gammaproteobacteria bacterium]|nr:alpha/beta hydrolase [Gammaproteobacteria bacterium]